MRSHYLFADKVRRFSQMMMGEFRSNEHKGVSYQSLSPEQSFAEILKHMSKLYRAMKANNVRAIGEHAADVANCALLVADRCNALEHYVPSSPGPYGSDY